jgi:hypothetical protein
LTLADAYKAIAAGAQGSDVTAFQAVVDAQAVLVGADDAAAFTLTAGLADIDAANTAVTSFIEANTVDTTVPEDGVGDGDAAEITGALTTAAGLLDTALEATDAVANSDFENNSVALRTALLSDANEELATELAAAQVTLTAKQAAVTDIAGLTAAITAYEAAQAETASATAAEVAAFKAFQTADATYDINGVDGDVTVTGGGVNTLITAYPGLIEVDGDSGLLVLATDITETTNPGIGAVLSAALAHNAAVVAQNTAEAAEAAALIEVGVLDTAGNDATLLTAVTGLMPVTTATYAEIKAFATDLAAGVATLKAAIESVTTDGTDVGDASAYTSVTTLLANAVTDGYIDGATETAITNAFGLLNVDGAGDNASGATSTTTLTLADAIVDSTDALDADNLSDEFDAVVLTYTNDAASHNTAADELVAAENAIFDDNGTPDDATDDSGIQFDIDTLAELASDAAGALATVTDLTALNTAVDDAVTVLTDMDYETPVTLTANVAATSGNDLYLSGSDSVSISNFNLLGNDTLYIGADYTLNAGAVATDGDNAVLEVFIAADGNNTLISLENTVFGSNSADAETVITLTGVDVADVSLVDGAITVA